MKTALVLLMVIAVASAVNLRAKVEVEDEVCQAARRHTDFLKSRMRAACGAGQRSQCKVLSSALALLQGSAEKHTVEEREENIAAKDEIAATKETGKQEELVGAAEGAKLKAAEAKLREQIGEGDGADESDTRVIPSINRHMRKVQEIFEAMKKEHVEKCNKGADAKGQQIMAAKTTQEGNFKELDDARADAIELKKQIASLYNQHDFALTWADKYDTTIATFNNRVNGLEMTLKSYDEWVKTAEGIRDALLNARALYDSSDKTAQKIQAYIHGFKGDAKHDQVLAAGSAAAADDEAASSWEEAAANHWSAHLQQQLDGLVLKMKTTANNVKADLAVFEKHATNFGDGIVSDKPFKQACEIQAKVVAWFKEVMQDVPEDKADALFKTFIQDGGPDSVWPETSCAQADAAESKGDNEIPTSETPAGTAEEQEKAAKEIQGDMVAAATGDAAAGGDDTAAAEKDAGEESAGN